MKMTILVFAILLSQLSFAAKSKILVYRGPGGCNSCAGAAAEIFNTKKYNQYKVEFVGKSTLNKETLQDAVLWVQPAGNAITAAKNLGEENLSLLREFVKKGGNYLGFCAGAFLSDKFVDDDNEVMGINILPFVTLDYEVNEEDNIDMTWINWNGKKRHVFFNGGATFDLQEQNQLLGIFKKEVPIRVIATYEADGRPAVAQTTYGLGNVVISGPHPEAPQTWKDNNEVEDEDGSDLDLARQLADLALSRK